MKNESMGVNLRLIINSQKPLPQSTNAGCHYNRFPLSDSGNTHRAGTTMSLSPLLRPLTSYLKFLSIHNRFGLDGEEFETVCELKDLSFNEHKVISSWLSAAAETSQTGRIEFGSMGTLLERKRFSSIEFISGAMCQLARSLGKLIDGYQRVQRQAPTTTRQRLVAGS